MPIVLNNTFMTITLTAAFIIFIATVIFTEADFRKRELEEMKRRKNH